MDPKDLKTEGAPNLNPWAEDEASSPFEPQDFGVKEKDKIMPLSVDEIVQQHEMSELIKGVREMVSRTRAAERRAEEAEREGRIDGLTQVYNRKYLDENLKKAVNTANRHKRPLSVIMMDIDHFKLVNDLNDHAWGDHKLREVASILKSNIRDGDFVARYGGEEFAVVLPETDAQSAAIVAEKLRELIEERALEDKRKYDEKARAKGLPPLDKLIGTVSMGCTELTFDVGSAEKLLESADVALFESKHNGRNRITIDSKLDIEKRTASKS